MKRKKTMKRKERRIGAAFTWVLANTTEATGAPVPREHRMGIRYLARRREIFAETVMVDVGTATKPRMLARYYASRYD